MFTISSTMILLCILVPLCAYMVAKWLFKKDTEIENRRRGAAKLARTLSGLGLVRLPDMLESYAVGDYSKFLYDIKQISDLFISGEAAVLEEFKQVFERVFEIKMKNPESRAYLAARLAEASVASDPNSKPQITAKL
jgi:hypothetical protein